MKDSSANPISRWIVILVVSACIAVPLLLWYNHSALVPRLPHRFIGTWNPKPDPMVDGHAVLTVSPGMIRHEGDEPDPYTWTIASVEKQRGWYVLTMLNTSGKVATQYRVKLVENSDHMLLEARWGSSDPNQPYGDWNGERTVYYRAP